MARELWIFVNFCFCFFLKREKREEVEFGEVEG